MAATAREPSTHFKHFTEHIFKFRACGAVKPPGLLRSVTIPTKPGVKKLTPVFNCATPEAGTPLTRGATEQPTRGAVNPPALAPDKCDPHFMGRPQEQVETGRDIHRNGPGRHTQAQ